MKRGRGTACVGAQAGAEHRRDQASLLVSVTIKPRTFVSVKRPIRCLVSHLYSVLLCIAVCSSTLVKPFARDYRSAFLTALHGVWSLTP